ncbi:MAG: hypothetical protein HC917_03860 [Richelia sp. SM2_1_7]|nr:hypothetical protein [Richelia sp. SM2_1_7]
MNKLKSQQVENIESQEVNQNPKEKESDKSASQQVENIESQEVIERIDTNPTSQEVNKLTSQQDNLIASQQVKQNPKDYDKPESQQVNKLVVRKSTFQLSSTILEQLDRLHLELQLELGKQDAPYKEVIVEERSQNF